MRLLQIDAFTSEPFKGNPAAVCFMDGARDDRWMANVAAEMNLAETAFLSPRDDGWNLRWFTPAVEVDLCGHATLASAHAIWSENISNDAVLRFHTKSGVLTAARDGNFIELDFPAKRDEAIAAPAGLLDALGIANATYVGRNQFDYIVELPSETELRNLKPDHSVLRQLPVRGVIVTSRAGKGPYDFVSRFFAPAVGVDEDPVTGSAHCCLTPFWAQRLGKNEMNAFQASPRGGAVRVRLDGDRVKLAGHAVTVFRGELVV
ncbi:MAG TPA: PhzF family phenazine biosynthesis protein [Thermoanaerobaculia bacterium]|jgi:PhzF family phenazine biosynthesis protein|nr:PhzF family phenazine biosynthesis protein [Thermoanaerobaculia bacterium]